MDDTPEIIQVLREEEKKGYLTFNRKQRNKKTVSLPAKESDILRKAIDHSADSIFLIDISSMKFIDVNKTACETTGYTREELLSMGPQDIKPDYSKSKLQDLFTKILHEEYYEEVINTIHQRKNGSTFPVEVYLTSLEQQNIIIASVRDVSTRQKIKRKLTEAYEIIEKSSSVAFTWRNVEGWPVSFVTENVHQIFGYTAEEFRSGSISYIDCIYPEDLQRVAQEVENAKEDDLISEFTHEPYRIITKQGSVKWVSDWTFIQRNESGKITHFKGIVEDITEKKEMISQLKESNEKYASLVNRSLDGVVIVQQEHIVFANKAVSQVTGFSVKELTGMYFLDVVADEEKSRIATNYNLRIQGGNVPNFYESVLRCKNGSTKPVEFSLTVIEYENQPAVLGVIRDISERKKNEQKKKLQLKYQQGLHQISSILLKEPDEQNAIQSSLHHLQNISDVSRVYSFKNVTDPGDGLCMKQEYEVCAPDVPSEINNPELQHVPYHPAFIRWKDKLSHNEPVYGLVKDFPDSEREILESQNIKSILVIPIFVNTEFYGFIGFDDIENERKWEKENIYLLHSAAERIGSYIERKRAYDSLKRSEEKFRSFVENANDIVYALSPEGVFTYVSPNWSEIVGHPIEEVIGSSFEKFVHPEDVHKCKDFLKKIIMTGKKQQGVEYRVRRIDGTYQWHTSNASPLPDEHGISYIGIGRDITKKKQVEREIQEKNEELRMMNQELQVAREQLTELNQNLEKKVKQRTQKVEALLDEKNEFISNLSHDLRTPLGPLVSLLPLLKSRSQNDKDKQMLELLSRNVDRINEIVVKTMKLTEMNALTTKFIRKPIHYSQFVDRIISSHNHVFEDNQVTVKNLIDHTIIVNADKKYLFELLFQLLSNAVKYMGGQGLVSINAFVENGMVTTSVSDDGIGLSKDQLNHVFDEFYKADESRHDLSSSGLGLAICKKIVERLDGKIWVESPGLGKGSTFYFSLPIAVDINEEE